MEEPEERLVDTLAERPVEEPVERLPMDEPEERLMEEVPAERLMEEDPRVATCEEDDRDAVEEPPERRLWARASGAATITVVTRSAATVLIILFIAQSF